MENLRQHLIVEDEIIRVLEKRKRYENFSCEGAIAGVILRGRIRKLSATNLSRPIGLVDLRRGAREDESIDSSPSPDGEMVNAGDLKSPGFGRAGSNPAPGTILTLGHAEINPTYRVLVHEYRRSQAGFRAHRDPAMSFAGSPARGVRSRRDRSPSDHRIFDGF
jgi:hypothetical protein